MECWTFKNFQLAVASFQVFVKICFSATYMCEWHVWRHCTKRLGWSRASLRTCWSKQAAAWLSITWSSSLARKWTSYLSAVRRTGMASSTSRWRFVHLVTTQPTPLWLPTCLIDLQSVEGVTYWCIGVSTAISVQISDILKTSCRYAAATTNPNYYNLQPFNGLFSRTTWVSRYQKGKTNLDFTGARDSEASAGPHASLHLAPDR